MPKPTCTRYAGYRFPCEIISHAVWLYFRFPLGLRMVAELLAARGIIVSYETVRQWARTFGQLSPIRSVAAFPGLATNGIWMRSCSKLPGVKHWLWRAVEQTGVVLDVLVQRRRDQLRCRRGS